MAGGGGTWRSRRSGVPTALGMAELERAPGERDLRLLLAHYPDTLLELARDSRVDLLVAGHTHGGQVQLPGLGPPITLSGVPRHMAAGGLSELDGRRVYISRGVGCERGWAPRLRLLYMSMLCHTLHAHALVKRESHQ